MLDNASLFTKNVNGISEEKDFSYICKIVISFLDPKEQLCFLSDIERTVQ